MSIALARAQTLQIKQPNDSNQFGLSWLSFIIAMVLGITIAGYFLANILAQSDREAILDIFIFIGTALFFLVFIIASPFLWVAQ